MDAQLVQNLKCNFVNKLNDYITCQKYSIDCCQDCVKTAYINYLYTKFQSCLTADDECYLSTLKLAGDTVTCSALPLDCTGLGTATLTSVNIERSYSTVASNEINGTAYPYIDLQDDTIYHKARIQFITTGIDFSNTETLESGQAFISGSLYPSDLYDIYASTYITLSGLANTPNAYLNQITLGRTDNTGSATTPQTIDISISSPYLSCPGCTTVDPLELRFDHSNFTTALENIISNAVLTLSGGDNISVRVADTPGSDIVIFTDIKNNPSGIWYGLSKTGSTSYSYTVNTSSFTGSSQVKFITGNGTMAGEVEIPLPCGPETITINNTLVKPDINAISSDFNKLSLGSVYTSVPITFTPSTSFTCDFHRLTATVVSSLPYTFEILDPSDDLVSTTSPVTIDGANSGTYTLNVTLDNSCPLTDTLLISAIR